MKYLFTCTWPLPAPSLDEQKGGLSIGSATPPGKKSTLVQEGANTGCMTSCGESHKNMEASRLTNLLASRKILVAQ